MESSTVVLAQSLNAPISKKIVEQPAVIFSTIKDACELPTINPQYATKRHRYVYGIADRGLSSFVDSLCKLDTKTGEAIYWGVPKHSPGEAIFVPRPSTPGVESAEDDGVLLSVVLDGPRGTSYLVCLDAKDLKEIARAEVESAVTIGFHGLFIEKGV